MGSNTLFCDKGIIDFLRGERLRNFRKHSFGLGLRYMFTMEKSQTWSPLSLIFFLCAHCSCKNQVDRITVIMCSDQFYIEK